jgi:hypothetical protein
MLCASGQLSATTTRPPPDVGNPSRGVAGGVKSVTRVGKFNRYACVRRRGSGLVSEEHSDVRRIEGRTDGGR